MFAWPGGATLQGGGQEWSTPMDQVRKPNLSVSFSSSSCLLCSISVSKSFVQGPVWPGSDKTASRLPQARDGRRGPGQGLEPQDHSGHHRGRGDVPVPGSLKPFQSSNSFFCGSTCGRHPLWPTSDSGILASCLGGRPRGSSLM